MKTELMGKLISVQIDWLLTNYQYRDCFLLSFLLFFFLNCLNINKSGLFLGNSKF